MDKMQAYYNLWAQFGLPAYDEQSVPDGAALPYITYQVILDDLDSTVIPNASLWYKDTSWEAIDKKMIEITGVISTIKPLKLDNGFMYVKKGTPWAQRMTDDSDDTIKRYIINLEVEFLTSE